ncbi:hypothetical protein AAY473_017511, partial [Plecturocebus cupreus]
MPAFGIISPPHIPQKHHQFSLKYRNKEYTQALQFLPHQRLELISSEVSGKGKQINLIVLSDNISKDLSPSKLPQNQRQQGVMAEHSEEDKGHSTVGRSLEVRSVRLAGKYGKNPSLLKIKHTIRMWWCTPVISATQEAEAGDLLESGRQRLHTLRGRGRQINRCQEFETSLANMPGVVVLACSPSYSGGGDRRIARNGEVEVA